MPPSLKSFFLRIPQRWIFVVMGFFGIFNGYTVRVCLSISITEMVLPIKESKEFLDETCPTYEEKTPANITLTAFKGGTYEWSEYTQGIILSSFYWGYVLTQLPLGMMAEKFGAKYIFSLGVLITGILSILSPYAIKWGDTLLFIIIRLVMGFCCGGLYPAANVMLSHWIPLNERSKAGSFVFAGAALGTVFATTVSGLILEYSNIGWPAVFYFFGCINILWFLVFTVLCYNSPLDHPFISEKEFRFLHEELSEYKHKEPPPVPWRKILTSKPVWAVTIASVGSSWGFFTMISDLPKYMSSVLKFSVQDNGYLSSLPYLCMWLGSIVSSWISDWLIMTNKMSSTNVRKYGTTIALVGPALFLIGASYAGCNRIIVVAMITLGSMLSGSSIPSISVNVLDLSPNYAGSLMAFANTLDSSTGIITPYVVGLLTPHHTLAEWRLVFWIVFAVFILSGIVFIFYASGDVQEWNDPEYLSKYKANKKKLTKEERELLPVTTYNR